MPEVTAFRRVRPTYVNKTRISVVLTASVLLAWQCGCTRGDEVRARQKVHETGQELKHETQEATQKLKQGAKEAAQELKREARAASSEIKKGGEKIKKEVDSK